MKAVALMTGFLLLALVPSAFGQEGPRPPVEILLTPGKATATPFKKGVAYANGGVIDVAQPNPTTVVVTMTGLTAANADLLCTSLSEYQFELAHCFEVAFNSKRVKSAKLTLEGRVVGLLRTEFEHNAGCLQNRRKVGTAETLPAVMGVSCGPQEIATLTLPGCAAPGCDDLSVYSHDGPVCVPIGPGPFTLNESWGFGVTHPAFNCKGASAEFSPQPYYVPGSYWFSEFRPFNGLATKDFGFQTTLKVIPEFKSAEEETPEKMP